MNLDKHSLLSFVATVLTGGNNELPFLTKFLFWTSLPIVIIDYIITKSRTERENQMFYDCIFTTDRGIRNEETGKTLVPATKPFTDFIEQAKTMLYICIFCISSKDVITSIQKAQRRGVEVTIVTDYKQGLLGNKPLQQLMKWGVKIYAKKPKDKESLMHHKFMIRDERIICLTSMNPTKNSVSGSFDNFLITNDETMVQAFKKQFEDLVEEFSS